MSGSRVTALPQADWLNREIEARRNLYPAPASPPRFSILTTVYERTDLSLFAEAADSLGGQEVPYHEWIVLAHGAITPALAAVLEQLAKTNRIRLLERPQNLGIAGGMRLCLDAAEGDYIIPMDADDLLTPDALRIMAAVIDARGRPVMLYSDEDILAGGKPGSPYRRPDWDPVLNLASSYIWHLCCVRRDMALALKLYTDSAADWCHDWDTVFRVTRAGHVPVHVPEILYHWRQHPASSTNQSAPEAGSRRSTRALLEAVIAAQPRPALYEVVDFPIFRGAPEWAIRRRPIEPPPVGVLVLGGRTLPPIRAPVRTMVHDASEIGGKWLRKLFGNAGPHPTVGWLREAIEELEEPYVIVRQATIDVAGDEWFWDAVGLLELHPEVAVVHGPLTGRCGRVCRGGEVFVPDGKLICPMYGKAASDAGPFAIMLKPHCVSACPTDFFMADTGFLRTALSRMPQDAPISGLGIRLGAAADDLSRRIAYTPLMAARLTGPSIDGSPFKLDELANKVLGRAGCRKAAEVIRGCSGFRSSVRVRRPVKEWQEW